MASRPHRRRHVVGVIIDGDVLRGVEVRRGVLGSTRAPRACEVPIPAGAVDGHRIVDPQLLVTALRDLWKTGGFRSKRIGWGLSGRAATLRPMTVPAAAGDDSHGLVRYEIANYLTYPIDEALTDHQIVGTTPEGTEVLAVAVPVADVEEIAAIADDAGLRVDTIGLAPTAMALAISAFATGDHESEAVVSIGLNSTTVVLRRDGRPRVVRVLSAGGGDRSDLLADEFASALASVEQFRDGDSEAGGDVPADEVSTVVPDAQEQRFIEAVDAVSAAIRYDRDEHTGTAVGRVVLTGAYGGYERLHELMAEASGVEVIAAPTPSWWAVEDEFDRYVAPAGLAYSALTAPEHLRYDFPVPSQVRRRRHRAELVGGCSIALAVAMAGLPLAGWSRVDARSAEAEATAVHASVAALASEVSVLEPVGRLAEHVDRESAALDGALADDLWWARILNEISVAAPDGTFLTSVSLVRPVVADSDLVASFTGVALDQVGVGRWLDAMTAVPAFDEVWLVQSTAGVHGVSATPVVSFLAEARLTGHARTPRAVGGAELVLAASIEEARQ